MIQVLSHTFRYGQIKYKWETKEECYRFSHRGFDMAMVIEYEDLWGQAGTYHIVYDLESGITIGYNKFHSGLGETIEKAEKTARAWVDEYFDAMPILIKKITDDQLCTKEDYGIIRKAVVKPKFNYIKYRIICKSRKKRTIVM